MDRKSEIKSVRHLGEQIGYGNMMEIASALWDVSLQTKYDIADGVLVPTIPNNIKLKPRKELKKRHIYIYNEVLRVDVE